MNVLILLIASVPLALLRGWVISLLWSWYVVDYFGARPLTIVEAVGISILASLFTAKLPTDEEEQAGVAKTLIWAVAYPLLGLLFGWLWSFVR